MFLENTTYRFAQQYTARAMKYLYNNASRLRLRCTKFKTFILILTLVCGIGTQVKGQIYSPDTVSIGASFTVSHNQTNVVSQNWDFGDGITGTNPTVLHSYSSSPCGYSSKTITLSIIDSNSTNHQYQKTVVIKNIVSQPILADTDPITPFSNCDNSPSLSNPNFTISLNNNTLEKAGIIYYLVSWGDNSAVDTVYNSSYPITHTYQNLGLFQLSITAFNAFGCSNTATYPIANQSNPAVGLSSLGSTQGCAPQEFTFILSQYQSNSPGTYYVWNFGDGSPQITWNYNTPYINDSIKHIFQATSCQNGGNSFTVSVTAYNYCDQTTATVSNIRIYTSPVAQFTPSSTTGCKNNPISFNNQTLSGFGYNCNGNASFLWDFGDGSISTQTNPQHSYNATGTYTVVLTASNGVCGISTDTATIIINETPKAKFANIATNSCDTLTIFPQNLSTGGNLSYKWIISPTTGWAFQNSTNKYSANPTIKFNQKGIYTVKLRATNNCGYDDTIVVIKIKSKPEIQLSSLQNFCGSGSVSPSAVVDSNYANITSYQWNFGNGNPATSNNLNAGLVNYNNSGIETIYLSVSNICGTTTDSTQFEIYALPQISAITTNPAICKYDSTTLQASGAQSYIWKDMNNNTFSINSSVNISPSNSQSYVVSGTDTHGCINYDTISIQVYNLPQISLNSSQNAICIGDTVQLMVSGAQNYNWLSNSVNIGQGANIQHYPNQSSWVKVIATDTNGCVSEDSTQIQVYTPPTLSISTTNPMICENDSVQIQINGAQNINITPSVNFSGTNYNFKPNTTTIYQINAYDLAGCTTDTTLTITVEKLPILSISQSANEICNGDSISFSATGATNFQWISNGQSISNQSFLNLQPQNTSSIILKGISSNGCINFDTASFIVHSLPNVQINSTANGICKGKSISLTASGANTYQWFKNGNSVSQNVSLTDTLFSTTSYKLTGIDSNGCSNMATKHITVHQPPVLQVSVSSQEICVGDSISVQLNGAAFFKMNNQNISSTTILKPTQNTIYQFVGSNAYNCSDSLTMLIKVNPLPQINATASPNNICLGLSSQLSANGGQTYFWIPASGLSNQSGAQTVATPSQSTDYIVTGIDSNGCKNRDTVSIFVSNQLNLQVAAINPNVCLGDTAILYATGAQTYNWSGGGNLLNTIGDTLKAVPSTNTSYIVTGMDSMGCISTKSLNINSLALPNIIISTSSNAVCPGDSILVSANGASSFIWNINNSSGAQSPFSGNNFYHKPTSNTTFQVTGIDVNQCKSTTSTQISYLSKPTIQLQTNDSIICQGSQSIITASGAQNYQWVASPFISQTNQPTAVVNPLNSSWFFVTGQGSNGCFNNDSIYIEVLAKPTISTNLATQSICSGDSATLSIIGNGQTTWYPFLGLNKNTGNIVKASPLSNQVYTAQLIDSNGCMNSINLQLTVNPLPVAAFDADSLVCKNSSVNFINQSTNTVNYSWNFGDSTGSNLQNPSHNYAYTGFVEASLIAISGNNCLDTIKKVIHIIDAPQANFATYPTVGCAPLSVNINNQSQSYSGSHFWNFGNGQNSNQKNPANIVFNSPQGHDTSYVIHLTTSNICGVSTTTDTVIVNTIPVANFGFITNTQCSPAVATFGNISSSNTNTYFWDLGDTSYTNQAVPNPHTYTTGNTPTDFQITLTASNGCGSDTSVKTLHLNPNYVQALFTPSTIQACAPAIINFSNFSNIQTAASWTFGDGNVSSMINPTHVYSNPGSYQVSLIVTDNCGIDTAITTIQVGTPPVMNFSMAKDTICQFEQIQLTNLTANVANLQWNFGDGTQSNLASLSHQFLTSGNLTITLIGEAINTQCTDTVTKSIVVYPSAQAGITVNNPDGCYPLSVQFQNTTTNGQYYEWDFDDGNNSISCEPSHIFSQPGNYNVKLIANNYYNCADTTYTIIKAYPRPTAAFSFTNTTPCSYPAQIQFTNTSTGANGYYWDFDNSDSSKLKNPLIQYANPGTYNPYLIATNTYNCTDTAELTFDLLAVPVASFQLTKNEGCEGLDIQFQNNSQNATDYQWDFGNGQSSTLQNPLEIYYYAGTYSPQLIATNDAGCADTLELMDTIHIWPNPQVDFTYESIEYQQTDRGKILFTNLSTQSNTFNWTFGDGDFTSEINPIHQYWDGGTYEVILLAENNYGCKGKMTKYVVVNMQKGLYIPNALAPNNPDPEVQKLTPVGKGLATYHLAVYDSWGTLLWETTQLQDGEPVESWNGKDFKGDDVPQGNYFWVAQATFEDGTLWQGMTMPNGKTIRQGTVTLIR